MSYWVQTMIAYEMFKQFLKETFGSGVVFPTAPGYVEWYVK